MIYQIICCVFGISILIRIFILKKVIQVKILEIIQGVLALLVGLKGFHWEVKGIPFSLIAICLFAVINIINYGIHRSKIYQN